MVYPSCTSRGPMTLGSVMRPCHQLIRTRASEATAAARRWRQRVYLDRDHSRGGNDQQLSNPIPTTDGASLSSDAPQDNVYLTCEAWVDDAWSIQHRDAVFTG
jgi:hypothetical protein